MIFFRKFSLLIAFYSCCSFLAPVPHQERIEPFGAIVGRSAGDLSAYLVPGSNSNPTTFINGAEDGYAEGVEASLEAKTDPIQTDTTGNSALISAARNGNTDIMQRLLTSKADPNVTDSEGNTPLMLAAANGHGEIVRYLLTANANVNANNNAGMSALLNSAEEGSPDIVSMLLFNGADKEAQVNGKSAIDLAQEIGNIEALAVLKGETPPESFARDFSIDNTRQPRDVRRYLLSSFIFRNAFLLTPSGQQGQALELTEDQEAGLCRELKFLIDSLNSMISSRNHEIQKAMKVSLLSTRSTKLILENSGNAEAYTLQTRGDPSGTIVIDVKLLQANIVAAITSSYRILQWELNRQPPLSEQLHKILELRTRLENYAYLNHIRVIKASGGYKLDGYKSIGMTERDAIHEVTQLPGIAQRVLPIGVKYYGTLLFTIAHELGHVALGHGVSQVRCPKRELDADTFAAYVLSEPLMAMSMYDAPISPPNYTPSHSAVVTGHYLAMDTNSLKSYTGYSLFFGKSYEIAKFGPSTQSCIYPEPAERIRVAEAAVEAVRSAKEDVMVSSLREKLKKREDREAFLNSSLVARLKVIEGMK
jgi:hypothetical protein